MRHAMIRLLRSRVALSIPPLTATPFIMMASFPVRDWSVGVGLAMLCAICALALHAIWTRPPVTMKEERGRPEDA